MSKSAGELRRNWTPPADVGIPAAWARERPGEVRFRPTSALQVSDFDCISLIARSVPMLPLPRTAARSVISASPIVRAHRAPDNWYRDWMIERLTILHDRAAAGDAGRRIVAARDS